MTTTVTSFPLSGGATLLLWPACLFTVHLGNVPSPSPVGLSSHIHFYNLSHSKIAVQVLPLLPSPASLFIYSSPGKCPFLPPVEFSSHCHFYKLSHAKVAGQVLPLLPSLASLFIYSSVRDCPYPPLRCSRHPALFATCLFWLLFIQFVLSLFSLSGGQSVQGAMLIWPKVVCGSTACCLAHLVVCVSRAGKKWCLVAWEPSWFLCLLWSGDAMRGLGVWRSQSFASSW
jgi:hypothetical protein